MAATDVFVAEANENGTCTLLGRLCSEQGSGATSPRESEGNLVRPADLTSATLYIFDQSTGSQVSGSPITLTVSSVVYDTLQTAGIWKGINRGGNFKYVIAAGMLPNGNVEYRAEVKFVPTGGTDYQSWGKWRIPSREILAA